MANVGNFLTDAYEEGKAYNTINTYRSAISTRHPTIDGHKVGRHPDIIRLMQGAFNTRPPVPRYADTWSVDPVLETIKGLGSNENMEMKILTGKLAMLMALTSAARGSELNKLKITNKRQEGRNMIFQLDTVTKTSRQGRPLLKLKFVPYEKDVNLDVVQCCKVYEDRTRNWRITEEQKTFLFLGLIKPHKPVAPCTIARWLLLIMEKSGINVDQYKAHSVRGAATSKAKEQGLSIPQIMRQADWSNANTFCKFYWKDVQDVESGSGQFQHKILD